MRDKIEQWLSDNYPNLTGSFGLVNPKSKPLPDVIEQCFNDLLSEPVAYMYQHEETGITGFVEVQQVEWGFQENNPRLQIICPVYRLPLPK